MKVFHVDCEITIVPLYWYEIYLPDKKTHIFFKSWWKINDLFLANKRIEIE